MVKASILYKYIRKYGFLLCIRIGQQYSEQGNSFFPFNVKGQSKHGCPVVKLILSEFG